MGQTIRVLLTERWPVGEALMASAPKDIELIATCRSGGHGMVALDR